MVYGPKPKVHLVLKVQASATALQLYTAVVSAT